MEPDPRPVSEDIISLTLEIVFLLTGEDYKAIKMSNDFANKGILGSKNTSGTTRLMVPPMSRSETVDKKVLEVSNKIIHLLTGEVWRFLGHAAVSSDVVKDRLQNVISPGSSDNETSPATIKKEPLFFEKGTLPPANLPKPSSHTEDNHLLIEKRMTSSLERNINTADRYVKTQDKAGPKTCDEKDSTNGEVYNNVPDLMHPYKIFAEPPPHSEVCRSSSLALFDARVKEESIPFEEERAVDGEGYTAPEMKEEESASPGHGEDPSIEVIEYNSELYGSAYLPTDPTQPTLDDQDHFAMNSELTRHSLVNFDCGSYSSENTILIRNEKQVSCPDCGKAFSTISNLIRHRRIHTGEKLFTCSDCGRSFNQKGSLINHRRTHTGEKPFVCTNCGKRFSTSANLTQHQKVHTGERPYTCPVCGKSFRSSPNLINHQRIHTGEKPYYCGICGKFFRSSPNLIMHQRIHKGEKPYYCGVCGKFFANSSVLVRHQKTHTA